MPLFRIDNHSTTHQISAGRFPLERDLHGLIEKNLASLFNIRFVASEYTILGEQPGRIDTLGLDSNGSPTIIEYKREEKESVINQGLYYLNWLVDHRGDFVVAAQKALGTGIEIFWDNPRLLIIAQSFAKWDTYAVKRMGDGIELWRYVLYGDDLFFLEQVYGQPRQNHTMSSAEPKVNDKPSEKPNYTVSSYLQGKKESAINLFSTIREGIFEFATEEGEIIETANKLYIAYRHGKNFCEIELLSKSLKITIDIPFNELDDPQELARDVSSVGHWGTGETQFKVDDAEQIQYALSLIGQSFLRTI
ncbi:MAG: hypothetical protein UZ15_CFX003002496 [Chloroflexi bacterium OLB15]|nr:MAG: hypothetical protein UZ15_CFX003002496 [Chloroflexi bacterium OLB15]